jgi:hypothetical protein
MASIYTNVFSEEELQYLKTLNEVLVARASLDTQSSGKVYFSVDSTNFIRDTLQARFGLSIPTNAKIPMRWIKGDTAPHIDVGQTNFTNTYLIYLNESPGELIVDTQTYPIQSNTGFVFNEGLSHKTLNTENVPRLLLGPMNEFIEPVGAAVTYFSTQFAAENGDYLNALTNGYDYTIQTIGGYTSWRIASNSSGSSPQNVVYQTGSILISDGTYNLYPSAPCFLEGTTVLCQVDGAEKYVPVEQLNKGTLVKTSLDGFKPVALIGKGVLENTETDERIENRLYKCATEKYPELTNDLYITGCHSILEFPITEQQTEIIKGHLGKLYVTDKKYRIPAHLDERAEPWKSKGAYTIWHFALEDEDERKNFGVYVNGALLVETCSIYFLKNKSNMELN